RPEEDRFARPHRPALLNPALRRAELGDLRRRRRRHPPLAQRPEERLATAPHVPRAAAVLTGDREALPPAVTPPHRNRRRRARILQPDEPTGSARPEEIEMARPRVPTDLAAGGDLNGRQLPAGAIQRERPLHERAPHPRSL